MVAAGGCCGGCCSLESSSCVTRGILVVEFVGGWPWVVGTLRTCAGGGMTGGKVSCCCTLRGGAGGRMMMVFCEIGGFV